MLTARELRLSGVATTLLERRETGRESTWAGGGILSPLYPWRYADAVTRLAAWGQERYGAVCAELRELTGVAPEWTQSGLLILDTEDDQQAEAWAQAHGRSLERIDGALVRQLEPGLADPPASALWLADVAQVRNPRMARALRLDLDRLGVDVREFTPAESLVERGERILGVRVREGLLEAERVVVCAGAWSAESLADSGIELQVRPVRGQMILFHAAPGQLRCITLAADRYTIPRQDGRVLMGSTLEEVGFDKLTTEQARDELYQLAISRFPALAACPLERHWAGLRPSSPSGIPFIGPHPRIQGLFINSGHFRNGVVLGLASARLAADLVLGREPILDPAPYALHAPR